MEKDDTYLTKERPIGVVASTGRTLHYSSSDVLQSSGSIASQVLCFDGSCNLLRAFYVKFISRAWCLEFDRNMVMCERSLSRGFHTHTTCSHIQRKCNPHDLRRNWKNATDRVWAIFSCSFTGCNLTVCTAIRVNGDTNFMA